MKKILMKGKISAHSTAELFPPAFVKIERFIQILLEYGNSNLRLFTTDQLLLAINSATNAPSMLKF